MPSLFDRTCGIEDPKEIYDVIERNYPGSPISRSRELWKLRRACDICAHNVSPEKMLEKAVAMLGESCHMPKWFNQCPVASGIVGSKSNRKNAVDLVHWSETSGHARLIELKWESDNPPYARREILRYGVAYLFCRVHKDDLPLQGKFYRPLMDAHSVALEVVAPSRFYVGHNEKDRFARFSRSLEDLASSKTGGTLSMSLNAFAFPEEFNQVPFNSGQHVKEKCLTEKLSSEGQMVRDAFSQLCPAWPRS